VVDAEGFSVDEVHATASVAIMASATDVWLRTIS
jgi:hypothetical protein